MVGRSRPTANEVPDARCGWMGLNRLHVVFERSHQADHRDPRGQARPTSRPFSRGPNGRSHRFALAYQSALGRRVYSKLCDLGIMSSAAVLVDLARPETSDAAVTVKRFGPRCSGNHRRRSSCNYRQTPTSPCRWPISRTLKYKSASVRAILLNASAGWPTTPRITNGPRNIEAWNQMKNCDSRAQSPKPGAPQPPEGRKPHPACAP